MPTRVNAGLTSVGLVRRLLPPQQGGRLEM